MLVCARKCSGYSPRAVLLFTCRFAGEFLSITSTALAVKTRLDYGVRLVHSDLDRRLFHGSQTGNLSLLMAGGSAANRGIALGWSSLDKRDLSFTLTNVCIAAQECHTGTRETENCWRESLGGGRKSA